MRGVILFSIAAFFSGLAGVSEATTCTKDTLFTCKKSLYMTGDCKQGVCTCIPNYTPGPFGCQTKQKAEITSGFKGELETGAHATLRCSLGIGEDTYKWFKGGKVITGQTKLKLVLTGVPSDDGVYTCQSNIAGIKSEVSDPFTVTVTAAASFKVKPVVKGMPTAVVKDTVIQLICDVASKYKTSYATWTLNGVVLSGTFELSIVHKVVAADAGQKVKCTVGGVVSEEVSFPKTLATDIDGVKIEAGTPTTLMALSPLTLHCELIGGFLNPHRTDRVIAYEWLKDGTTIPGQKYVELHIPNTQKKDSGSYTCKAKAGTNPAKESPALAITIITTDEKPCSKPGDCGGANEKGTCTNGKCDCDANYQMKSKACAAKTCKADGDCDGDNVECKSGACACKASSTATNGYCLLPDDKACSQDSDCNGANMKTTCRAGKCECHSTFKMSNKICVAATCNKGTDCKADNTECKSSKCVCKKDFPLTGGVCLSVDVKTCAKDADCKDANMEPTCSNGQCKCKAGYKMKSKKCSGAAAVIGSLLMMGAALLTHRIF